MPPHVEDCARPPTGSNRSAAGWRLGRGWRRAILIVHVISAGAWIGIDVIVAVLVVAGRVGSTTTRSVAYQALGTFVVWPMFTAGVASLLSGVILGLGTKWGLVRYWWVLVKLALNLALCVLIVILLQPGMADVAAWGRALPAGGPEPEPVTRLFFPPAVSLSALTFATTLAVVKPWGRIRRRGASPHRLGPNALEAANTSTRRSTRTTRSAR